MAYIDDVFRRYLDNTCSEVELDVILRYFEQDENTETVEQLVQLELLERESEIQLRPNLQQIVDNNREVIYDVSEKDIRKMPDRKVVLLKWIAVAASVFLVAGVSIWWYQRADRIPADYSLQADIAPGTNRATLTLSDGQSVSLSENQTELITGADGLTYKDGTAVLHTAEVRMAFLVTPRAGQYQVTLPDGSRVWLNAASTLRYPTRFLGATRKVELQGEAYFEVTKKQTPFIVVTAGQEITVLGTHFNVMAYAEEPAAQTTLVEGKVRVSASSGDIKELAPGLQSTLNGEGLHIQQVNTDDYTAWREGIIVLERQPLQQVFRQIERWYDIEFTVEQGVKLPSETLSGDVLRDLPLTALLQTLSQQTGLRFERKERRVMVKGS